MAPEIEVGVPAEEVSTSFPVAPAGTYRARIAKVIPGTSRADKPKLVFVYANLEPIEGSVKENGEDKTVQIPPGREMFRQSVSTAANALFTLKGIANACGGKGYGGKSTKVRTEEFIGCPVRLVVTKTVDTNGKVFNSVEDVLSA